MPLEDTIQAIPQSDTDTIARRLLGDDMVDRFGDVIGARPHGLRDVARDFALGVSGGPTASLELRTKVQEQFQKAYNTEAKAAAARAQQDRETATMVINTLKTVSGLPPGHRASIFQETLDQAGIPYSKAAVKFLVDADTAAQLPMPLLFEKARSGELTTANISAVLGSASNTARWYTDMMRASRDRIETGNKILEAEKKALSIRDLQEKMRIRAENERVQAAGLRERVKAQKLGNVKKRRALDAPPKGAAGGLPEDIAAELSPAAGAPVAPAAIAPQRQGAVPRTALQPGGKIKSVTPVE